MGAITCDQMKNSLSYMTKCGPAWKKFLKQLSWVYKRLLEQSLLEIF